MTIALKKIIDNLKFQWVTLSPSTFPWPILYVINALCEKLNDPSTNRNIFIDHLV